MCCIPKGLVGLVVVVAAETDVVVMGLVTGRPTIVLNLSNLVKNSAGITYVSPSDETLLF